MSQVLPLSKPSRRSTICTPWHFKGEAHSFQQCYYSKGNLLKMERSCSSVWKPNPDMAKYSSSCQRYQSKVVYKTGLTYIADLFEKNCTPRAPVEGTRRLGSAHEMLGAVINRRLYNAEHLGWNMAYLAETSFLVQDLRAASHQHDESKFSLRQCIQVRCPCAGAACFERAMFVWSGASKDEVSKSDKALQDCDAADHDNVNRRCTFTEIHSYKLSMLLPRNKKYQEGKLFEETYHPSAGKTEYCSALESWDDSHYSVEVVEFQQFLKREKKKGRGKKKTWKIYA